MRFVIRSLVAVITGWVSMSYGLQSLGFSLSECLRSGLFLVFFSHRVTSTDLVYVCGYDISSVDPAV